MAGGKVRSRPHVWPVGFLMDPARRNALIAARDALSDYFLDHCPEGVNWEEFDPEIDSARESINEALGDEA